MKALVVLVLVVAAAVATGWKLGWFSGAPAAETPTFGEQPTPAPGDGQRPAPLPTTWDAPGLPADAAKAFAEAQVAWDACKDPATDAKACELLAAFTGVLRAAYGVESLQGFRDRLVAERLDPLAKNIFFTAQPVAQAPFCVHVVAPGETLDPIGRTYGLSYQFANILRGRDADDRNLAVGEQLKMIQAKDRGGFLVRVDKSEFVLDLLVCDLFVRRYPVGLGKAATPTPVGRARIDQREWHPPWTPPGKQPVQWDDPENILGPVWMQLKEDELKRSGIGIHGFNGDPAQAVRVLASNGCVRMRNPDAIELYRLLPPVVYSKDKPGELIQRAPAVVEIVE